MCIHVSQFMRLQTLFSYVSGNLKANFCSALAIRRLIDITLYRTLLYCPQVLIMCYASLDTKMVLGRFLSVDTGARVTVMSGPCDNGVKYFICLLWHL